MSCRESHGGRLTTALARDVSGLNDVQVLSIFHRLVREGGSREELTSPSSQELDQWLDHTVEQALSTNPNMSANRRQRLQDWATAIRQGGPPPPANWYAWQNLSQQASTSRQDLSEVYSRMAQTQGIEPQALLDRARQLEQEYARLPRSQRREQAVSVLGSSSSSREGEGSGAGATSLLQRLQSELEFSPNTAVTLPPDGATQYAVATLLNETVAARAAAVLPITSPPSPATTAGRRGRGSNAAGGGGSSSRRNANRTSTPANYLPSPIVSQVFESRSSALSAAAYNPDTQKLEIRFNNGSVYRYYGISSDIANELMNGSGSVGRYYSNNIRGLYPSQRLAPGEEILILLAQAQRDAAAHNGNVQINSGSVPTADGAGDAGVGSARDSAINVPAQRQADTQLGAARQSSQTAQVGAAQAQTAQAQASTAPSYSENMSAFQGAYNRAKQRKANGEAPIPYVTTANATGGLGAREGGRGFGVELEFDLRGVSNKEAALRSIGSELYASGLTRSARQQGYHSSTDYSSWRYEEDETVEGEIISPIMYDEPQTWEQIAKVCEIVERHGGKATARTGGHVHVSCSDYDHTPSNHTNLLNTFKENEDVIYRLAQNPAAAKHRGTDWCRPNNLPSTPFRSINEVNQRYSSHNIGLNFGGVSGTSGDHVEYRMWDGSLNPSVIQTQIKMSLALTQHAFAQGASNSNATQSGGTSRPTVTNSAQAATRLNSPTPPPPAPAPTRTHEPLGSHLGANERRARQAATGQSSTRPRQLTGEAWVEDTASFRNLVDRLFSREEDKEQVTALFATTKWQQLS